MKTAMCLLPTNCVCFLYTRVRPSILTSPDKDEAAYEAHFKTSYFVELTKSLPEEQVLGAPLDIKKVKPFAGFASR